MSKIEKTTLKRYTGGNPCCGEVGEWISIYLENSSDITRVGHDILVSNPIGMLEEGTVVSGEDYLFNVIQSALTKYSRAVYVAPTLKVDIIDGPEPGSYPPGTVLSAKVRVTATQNDAGDLILITLFSNGQEIARTDSALTLEADINWALTEKLTLTATYQYADGPLKNDSFGNPDPEGRILAGTITATAEEGGAEYTVQYTSWMGSDSVSDIDAIPTESEIKALANPVYDIVKGDHYDITFPAGNNRFIIAVPAEIGDIESIIYREAGYQEIHNLFTVADMDIHVSDIDPDLTHAYKVYYATWQQPMVADLTIMITI